MIPNRLEIGFLKCTALYKSIGDPNRPILVLNIRQSYPTIYRRRPRRPSRPYRCAMPCYGSFRALSKSPNNEVRGNGPLEPPAPLKISLYFFPC